jgi:hypothetical protein
LAKSFWKSGKSVGWSHEGGFFAITHWGASARLWVRSRFGDVMGNSGPGSVWSMGYFDRPRWSPVGLNTSLMSWAAMKPVIRIMEPTATDCMIIAIRSLLQFLAID